MLCRTRVSLGTRSPRIWCRGLARVSPTPCRTHLPPGCRRLRRREGFRRCRPRISPPSRRRRSGPLPRRVRARAGRQGFRHSRRCRRQFRSRSSSRSSRRRRSPRLRLGLPLLPARPLRLRLRRRLRLRLRPLRLRYPVRVRMPWRPHRSLTRLLGALPLVPRPVRLLGSREVMGSPSWELLLVRPRRRRRAAPDSRSPEVRPRLRPRRRPHRVVTDSLSPALRRPLRRTAPPPRSPRLRAAMGSPGLATRLHRRRTPLRRVPVMGSRNRDPRLKG